MTRKEPESSAQAGSASGPVASPARGSSAEGPLHLGRLPSVSRDSVLRRLRSNFRDFLFERPVKLRGGESAFSASSFGASFGANLKEFFRPAPRRVRSGLLVNWNESGAGFWQNLRDFLSSRKLRVAPGEPVPEIWSKDSQFKRSLALSVTVNVALIALAVLPFLPSLLSPPVTKASTNVNMIDDSLYLPKIKPGPHRAGGGGGQVGKQPAVRGKLPKFSWTQFAPPLAHPMEHPQMPVTATVVGNPRILLAQNNARNFGDPLSKVLDSDSMGNGQGTGVGNGNGAGVGPGQGYGTGGGFPTAGENGYGDPDCLYCPSPQFTDEAVKEKYQGTVVLVAVITPEGTARDIHIAEGLGLGLNEKAIEAVRTWRFRPALGPDGRPAAVRAAIDVEFHLY